MHECIIKNTRRITLTNTNKKKQKKNANSTQNQTHQIGALPNKLENEL